VLTHDAVCCAVLCSVCCALCAVLCCVLCQVCLFPEFSTLISATFALMYLLVLWAVLGRVAGAAINRMLSRRIRLLQVGGVGGRGDAEEEIVRGRGHERDAGATRRPAAGGEGGC